MNEPIFERRRSPRVALSAECRVPLGIPCAAQVLDLSPSGALLASKTELSIGDRGELRATVGERMLRIAIEIRSVSLEARSRGGSRYRLGAVFVGMTMEQRVLLLELLGAEPN
jgi:hypothetical protein